MNKKSYLYEELSENKIQNIVKKYFDSDVVNYNLLKGGLFNTTYSVELKNGSKYVLRVGPVREDLLLPMEKNLSKAEMLVCNLLQKNKVPSNNIAAYDFDRNEIDRDIMFFKYIDGLVLSDKQIKKSNSNNLYFQTGKWVKQMHEIEGNYFGRISNQFRSIKHKTWSEYIFFELEELKNACAKHDVISKDDFNKTISSFEKNKHLFDAVDKPSLVHGDLWAGNIMINKSQSSVAAIIDTDRCLFGDLDMDLAAPWMINESFLEGYGTIPNSKEREQKLTYYRLIYAIIDAYVWKVEYNSKIKYKHSVKTVKQLMKKINKF